MANPKPPRFSMVNGTVGDFITEGFSEIEEVGNEYREIYDNAPENLQQTGVNQTRDSTASEIEGMSEPSVDSSILSELDCSTQIDNGKLYRGRQSQSRACRAANGGNRLRAAAEAVRAWAEENSGEARVEEDSDQPGKWLYFVGDEGSDISYDTEEAAKEALEEKLGHSMDDYNEAVEAAEDLANECEEIADNIDGLEYPGMFG